MSTDLISGIICIPPEEIRPIHEPRDMRLFEKLLSSMKRSGWLGRPLLAVESDGSLQALTGSHRLSAAQEAALQTIPVLVVDGPPSDVIRSSRYFPSFPAGVAGDLFKNDESWLGRYILMDDWARTVKQPWSKKYLETLHDLGHRDMLEIMKVRKWHCQE